MTITTVPMIINGVLSAQVVLDMINGLEKVACLI